MLAALVAAFTSGVAVVATASSAAAGTVVTPDIDGSSRSPHAGIAWGIAPAVAAGSVWDDLAECESSGDWSINTGNGYHGGLQFHPDTWDAYGGEQFAEKAYEATRDEQIAVAMRVQEDQGWGAWPSCTRQLGLR